MSIHDARKYPLSDDDMRHLLGKDTCIITYPELRNYKTIPFDKQGRCIVLFLTDTNVGHWVGIIRHPTEIEYFDPYGEPPEGTKDWLSKSELIRLGQNQNDLLRCLIETCMKERKNLVWCLVKLQKEREDNNTCGRHVAARMLYKKPLESYITLIRKSKLSPDEFVIGATTTGVDI